MRGVKRNIQRCHLATAGGALRQTHISALQRQRVTIASEIGSPEEVIRLLLLILESLGSTELLFILAMALVFFGPRKLPQLSRSLGKSMAEFRRASDDFKRTWAREVNLEESLNATSSQPTSKSENNSIASNGSSPEALQSPMIAAISPDLVVAREHAIDETISGPVAYSEPADEFNPSAKSDWL